MGKQAISVLLIDDEEDYLILCKDYLAEFSDTAFTVDWCSNYDSGMAAIMEKKHDVYLIDYRLGARLGLDLIVEALAMNLRSPIILLTGQGEREIDLAAIKIGADDYLEKADLSATLLERSIRYAIERKTLLVRIQEAVEQIKTLNGLLPICMHCKKIRDDNGYWNQLEKYIQTRTEAEFSHGICPECIDKVYPEYAHMRRAVGK